MSKLTPTQLATHLACGHFTQLDRQRRAGELKVELNVDPRLEAMRQRGAQHEGSYVDRLRLAGRSICDLRDERDAAATLKAMQNGVDAIVQAPLSNASFFGIADVLVRVNAPSALGVYSYEALDTKLSSETKAGTILQLCTYCEMLEAMQGRVPEHFHVVTPVREEHFRSADFAAYYRFVKARLNSAVVSVPAHLTYPDPVPHCDVCPYWKFCDKRRRSDDHPSLIADIRTGQVREFQRHGLRTVASIAGSGGKLPAPPSRGSVATYARLGHQARLQIDSRVTETPIFDFLSIEPARGFQRLPQPSLGDVFLDFEGDPFVGEAGLEYLTGYCIRDEKENGNVSFQQLWAFDQDAEKQACEHFLDFVVSRLREHPDLHVYHFGSYEPSALKRLCARYSTRGEELDVLLRGGRFVDLHAVVREACRIGVERYGLKELEPLHAFRRTLDLRAASIARRDLELALELGQSTDVSPELRELVAAYNRDDCLSTEVLHSWLEHQRSKLVEQGHTISRPKLETGEASAQVSERDLRIQALKQALTEDLPADPTQRSPEQTGRALLASMLGYFRQEEKNAWWEFFRLRDLSPEEHFEEREMLAGLEFVDAFPPQGRERNSRYRYSFPPQDTAIELGDRAYFAKADDLVDGKPTSMMVVEMDRATGTVVFSAGKAVGDRRPRSVFREQVVASGQLESSLLAFAQHVRDSAFPASGPYAAASQLLLRRNPQLRGGHGGVLRQQNESSLNAAKRLCVELDHGVLPIQGPPGSGKTYVGARAIVALAQAGKKVGITAVSHKVIDNLLEEIRDSITPGTPPLRLVHKHDEEPPTGIEYKTTAKEALGAVGEKVVIGGTVWLWAMDEAVGALDYLFVDEAGQMALAHALAAARSACNVVLLGDPQQLEQPTKGAHPDGADVAALVHVIGKGQATMGNEQGLFLDRTYRLHPHICGFTSELYYENRLLPIEGLEQQHITGNIRFAGAGLFLVEVAHEGNQAQSNEEIATVAAIVEHILQTKVDWTDRRGNSRELRPDDLLVVAPYNAQVSALRRRLAAHGVKRVGTVDKFQGQEAPVVIYSCTASSHQDAPRGMGFLYDPHRFNVATSRAQAVVIVVASPALFEPECRTPEQMLWANGLCRYRELAKSVSGFTPVAS